MIAGIPGGATLAALAVCWLGTTAATGRHARRPRLRGLTRWLTGYAYRAAHRA